MTESQIQLFLRLLERITLALEALVETTEHQDEVASRAAALDEWRNGHGKHPDD